MSGESDDYRGADRLMSDLTSDPKQFRNSGLGNELLNHFLRGYPIDNLVALLRHHDNYVLRCAIWIGSELPKASAAFLDDAIVLLSHQDVYIRHYAIEIIFHATAEQRSNEFVHVLERMGDADARVAGRATTLLPFATTSQLDGAISHLELSDPQSRHLPGLRVLQKGSANQSDIEKMARGDDLEQRYALAFATRARDAYPQLLNEVSRLAGDEIKSLASELKARRRSK